MHPFDSFFQPIADRSFPEFEAEQSGELELEQFGRLPAVRAFLESAGVTLEDSPQVFEEYLTAVYVAYRFWRAGKPTSHASAELLAPPYVFSAVSVQAFPKQAIYLELPPQKFWAQVSPELPHEPLNGLFVVAEPKQSWLVMAVLGLHPGRDGFSQVHVRVTEETVLEAGAQQRHPPFAPTMDGGGAAGFLSVASEAELVSLTHLALERLND